MAKAQDPEEEEVEPEDGEEDDDEQKALKNRMAAPVLTDSEQK